MTVFLRLNATPDGQPRTTLAQNTGPRFPFASIGSRALGCETAMSNISFDDFSGSLSISTDLPAFRGFRIEESECSNPVVFTGNLWDRTNSRGGDDQPSNRTGTARKWEMQVSDFNFQMRRRAITGSDGKRPAETDIERLTWLLGSAYTFNTEDLGDGLFDTANPVGMDAADYRKMFPFDVVSDCMGASGKNAFVYDKQTGGTGSDSWIGGFAYFQPTSSTYTSTLSLSNVLSEVDSTTIFAPDENATLKSDPTRVFTGIVLVYDGGWVYRLNSATAAIYGTLDVVIDDPSIKTQAAAIARAERYLADYSFEEDIITTTVQVPAAKVNLILQGHRVACKFTHFPGYSTSTYRRVAERNVSQSALEGMYDVTLELRDPRLIGGSIAQPVSAGTTDGTLPFTGCEATIIQTQPFSGFGLTFDATPAPGNLLVVVAVVRNLSTLTAQTGWTMLATTVENDPPASISHDGVAVFYRTADGTTDSYAPHNASNAFCAGYEIAGGDTPTVATTNTGNGVGPTGSVSGSLPAGGLAFAGFSSARDTDVFGGQGLSGTGTVDQTNAASPHPVTLIEHSASTGALSFTQASDGNTWYWAGLLATVAPSGDCGDPITGQPVPDQTPIPAADGSTTTFTNPSPAAYIAGSLIVLVDDLDQTDHVTETSPSAGTFTLDFAPASGDVIRTRYQSA